MSFVQCISGQEELTRKVISFFTSRATCPKLFTEIQEHRRARKRLAGQDRPDLDVLIDLGGFTLFDFLMFEEPYAKSKGIPVALVEVILERMVEKWILIAEPLLQRHGRAYFVNEERARFLSERNCLDNAVLGFQFIAQKYEKSIYKIVVTDRYGDSHIGTGFLLSFQGVSVVVTNKHVIDETKALRILRPTNAQVPHSRVHVSRTRDLAAIELAAFDESPSFCLGADPQVLEEVISVGYPNVAMAADSFQLVHRGEVNSLIRSQMHEALILFSAKTAPGNSGGPLINELGLVVGIISQDLFCKDDLIEKGQLPYHAAIPSSAITEFFSGEFPKLR